MKADRRSLAVSFASAAAAALALQACGGTQKPAEDAAGAPVVAPAEGGADAARDRQTSVQISATLRDRCRLTDVEGAPGFEFDQSTLHARGKNVLDDVAVCLTQGPLKGETVTIVGRADPRGNADHNAALSATRAAAARNYLTQHGVPAAQLKLMARGEEGASGSDEATWALDRRVDLELGDLQKSPILEGSMIQAETANKPSNSPEAQKARGYADVTDGKSTPATAKGGTTAAPGK